MDSVFECSELEPLLYSDPIIYPKHVGYSDPYNATLSNLITRQLDLVATNVITQRVNLMAT